MNPPKMSGDDIGPVHDQAAKNHCPKGFWHVLIIKTDSYFYNLSRKFSDCFQPKNIYIHSSSKLSSDRAQRLTQRETRAAPTNAPNQTSSV